MYVCIHVCVMCGHVGGWASACGMCACTCICVMCVVVMASYEIPCVLNFYG